MTTLDRLLLRTSALPEQTKFLVEVPHGKDSHIAAADSLEDGKLVLELAPGVGTVGETKTILDKALGLVDYSSGRKQVVGSATGVLVRPRHQEALQPDFVAVRKNLAGEDEMVMTVVQPFNAMNFLDELPGE